MVTKNDIKLIRSLNQKKYRQKYNKFVVEGEKMANECLQYKKEAIKSLYYTEDYYTKNQGKLAAIKDKCHEVSPKDMDKMTLLKTPSPVLVLCEKLESKFTDFSGLQTAVYLDDISDPGNLGTIIRTCDWFDIDLLIASKKTVDLYNPKVIQSSMGSIFRLKILIEDFEAIEENLKNNKFTFYSAVADHENINKIEFSHPSMIIIGNESIGISPKILDKSDKKISIPRYNKEVESLNAAIATSIILAELKK